MLKPGTIFDPITQWILPVEVLKKAHCSGEHFGTNIIYTKCQFDLQAIIMSFPNALVI